MQVKNILVALFAVIIQTCAFGKVIHVMAGSNGNGSSWATAVGSVSEALKLSTKGDQLWVSGGIYRPTGNFGRENTFGIPDGVMLYGGFSGKETSIQQRNWTRNPTVLSGDNGTSSITDDLYNVIITRDVSAATLLDGFVITSGNANADGQLGNRTRSGGGWYNLATTSASKSNPTIFNCRFENNIARDGAAIYNLANTGEASPSLYNCQFINNRADLDGGAIYNDGTKGGICAAKLELCLFENNEATYGGSIFNSTGSRATSITIDTCQFKNNTAYLRGGGIFSMAAKSNAPIDLSDSKFSNNYPNDNEAMFNANSPEPGLQLKGKK